MKVSLKVWLDVYPRHYWWRFAAFLKRVRDAFWLRIPRVNYWTHKTEIFGKPHRGFHLSVSRR